MNDDEVTKSLEDLRDMIVGIYPGRSVCLDFESWHHEHAPNWNTTSARLGVGILPGDDGSKCQRFYFETIADLREWIENHKEDSVTV